MDFINLGFIHYNYEIDFPFVCGDEALFSLNIISYLVRSSGGFKMTSEYQSNTLYRAVFDGYLHSLLQNNQLLEVFLERNRSRSGKV